MLLEDPLSGICKYRLLPLNFKNTLLSSLKIDSKNSLLDAACLKNRIQCQVPRFFILMPSLGNKQSKLPGFLGPLKWHCQFIGACN